MRVKDRRQSQNVRDNRLIDPVNRSKNVLRIMYGAERSEILKDIDYSKNAIDALLIEAKTRGPLSKGDPISPRVRAQMTLSEPLGHGRGSTGYDKALTDLIQTTFGRNADVVGMEMLLGDRWKD